jgi:hypothetical protein
MWPTFSDDHAIVMDAEQSEIGELNRLWFKLVFCPPLLNRFTPGPWKLFAKFLFNAGQSLIIESKVKF